MKLPENSQFQQLVFDLLGSPWRTNVPGIFVFNIYRKICICNLFSCCCQSSYLFCAQSAEDPELPVITANGAVPHHLLPLLVKEPCSTKMLQNGAIDMHINVKDCFVSHDDILGELLVLDFTIVCKLVLSISGWNLQKEQCRKQREGERKPCRQ